MAPSIYNNFLCREQSETQNISTIHWYSCSWLISQNTVPREHS